MTLLLIVLNVVFSYAAFTSREVMGKAIFNPYLVSHNKEWWRFITSGFIHADWLHLGVNMFTLYFFGDITLFMYKIAFGDHAIYYFLVMYFGGMIVACLPAYQKHKDDPGYNALGASGAISSLLFAFIIFQPMEPIYLYGVIGLPGVIFAVLYLFYSNYAAKRARDNIGHEAHLWGAIFGFTFTLVMKPELFSKFIESITGFLR